MGTGRLSKRLSKNVASGEDKKFLYVLWGDSCNNNCWGINRVRKRLPYIFWSNVVLVSIIIISLFIEYVD